MDQEKIDRFVEMMERGCHCWCHPDTTAVLREGIPSCDDRIHESEFFGKGQLVAAESYESVMRDAVEHGGLDIQKVAASLMVPKEILYSGRRRW